MVLLQSLQFQTVEERAALRLWRGILWSYLCVCLAPGAGHASCFCLSSSARGYWLPCFPALANSVKFYLAKSPGLISAPLRCLDALDAQLSHLTFAIYQQAPCPPASLPQLSSHRAAYALVISSFSKSTISKDLRWGFKSIPFHPPDYLHSVSRGNENRRWSAKPPASLGRFTGRDMSKPPWWLGWESSAVSPHASGCHNPVSTSDLPFLCTKQLLTTTQTHFSAH